MAALATERTLSVPLYLPDEKPIVAPKLNARVDQIFDNPNDILHKVQTSAILGDGKEFVDMPAKLPIDKVWDNWEKLAENSNITDAALKAFVEENFGEPGWELEGYEPEGWVEVPKYLDGIKGAGLRHICLSIQTLWKTLGKRVKPEVVKMKNKTSMLYLPNTLVIPGGRFREIYYWDTYWIHRALLLSDMHDTAKGLILNNFHLIGSVGFIPNGTRTYYLNRSQPPIFLSMVEDYVNHTKDVEGIALDENVGLLQKEMHWWVKNRRVAIKANGKTYHLYRFDADGFGPRPESYKEDIETAEEAGCKTEEEREGMYRHLKAGAESGWDFSSRWFIDEDGGCSGGMENLRTRFIIPTDLNAILFRSFKALVNIMRQLGFTQKDILPYQQRADEIKEAMSALMFDEKTKTWRDYDILNNKQRPFYAASNLSPLWAGCFDEAKKAELGDAAVEYLTANDAIFPGGIVTTASETGQQWDAPNCWPPLQEIIVTGLLNTGSEKAVRTARSIARMFVSNALVSCSEDGVCEIYEKYDAAHVGHAGGGGEYVVQTGFGWTNGVIVGFVHEFGDALLSKHLTRHLDSLAVEAPEKIGVPGLVSKWATVRGVLKTQMIFNKINHIKPGQKRSHTSKTPTQTPTQTKPKGKDQQKDEA